TKRSVIAKLNSFSYFLIKREGYLEKAKLALLNIAQTYPARTPEGGEASVGWGDWMQASEALRNYAVAYDLLYDYFSDLEKKQIESALAAQTEQIYQNFSRFPSSFDKLDLATGLGIPKNNHIIDIALGVLTVALVIDDERAALWLEAGLDEFGKGLSCILADGSYKEGAFYGQFVASRIFQFALYYYNSTGINIHKVQKIKKLTTWLNDIELSDGSVPMWDDAKKASYLFQPMAVGLSEQSEDLRARYEMHPDIYKKNDPRFVEAFCGFDNSILPSKLENKTKYYANGGQIIFKNEDHIQGLFLAEPKATLSKHDHIEPTAFTLYAYKKHFLIDSGYGPDGVNDVNRSWYISPKAHNLPLVNGFGPDQNPVWGDKFDAKMENGFANDNISTAKISTRYRDTDVERTAIMTAANYFVIIDSLSSDDLQRYMIPWHGLGDFRIESPNRAVWKQDAATLTAEFISLEAGILRSRLGLNTYTKKDNEHQIAEFAVNVTKSAKVVSLLLPENADNNFRVVDIHIHSKNSAVGKKISKNGTDDLLILAKSDWDYMEYASDAEFCFIQDRQTKTVFLQAASWFKIGDDIIFKSNEKIDIMLDLTGHNWQGFIDTDLVTQASRLGSSDNSNEIILNCLVDPKVVFINDKITQYKWNDKVILHDIEPGVFAFGKPTEATIIEPVRQDFPMLMKLENGYYEDLLELDETEKVMLRNEIFTYSSKNILARIDRKTDNMITNIYGIGTGMLANCWDAEESFGFSLPQKLELDRDLWGHRVKY
ncbi:MAG: heparinase II/III family protein, partial [Candidatus Cloacimonetes bacterium]|nr:heparinase II/III family protein [Candidatus Cloacimonadota bacterium]